MPVGSLAVKTEPGAVIIGRLPFWRVWAVVPVASTSVAFLCANARPGGDRDAVPSGGGPARAMAAAGPHLSVS